jgi:cobalamin-dependent methionine synthase I
LFAATAGSGIDRLILKYNKLSPARAVVIQAMGAALVEQWCDEICDTFTQKLGANKNRFSCGYGDLPLTLQREIFPALNVTKNLGITLSDNCFMTPSKSVTAIVGIK